MNAQHPMAVECVDTNKAVVIKVSSQSVIEAIRALCSGQYMEHGQIYHGVLMAQWRDELIRYSAVAIVKTALAHGCTPAELWHGIETLQSALYRRGGSGVIDGPARPASPVLAAPETPIEPVTQAEGTTVQDKPVARRKQGCGSSKTGKRPVRPAKHNAKRGAVC